MAYPAQLSSANRQVESRLRISLCLLTWNEVDGCRKDVPLLPRDDFDEVFAVDGGSNDGTVEYLTSQGISVYQQERRGYNQAYHCAFRHCTTDALVIFHPKGTVDPREVSRFRSFFEQGHDLVVASRMIDGARNEEDARILRPRKWFVLGLGLLSSLLWRRSGPLIWDVLHGFRGMRPQCFFAIEPLDAGLTIDLEMVARAYRKGYHAVEFPVVEHPRSSGTTHFRAFRTGRQLLGYLLKEMMRKA